MTRISISLFNARRTALMLVLALCAFTSALLAANGKLLDVRVGTHRQHDRLVIEVDHEANYTVNTDQPGLLTIRLVNVAASNTFVLPDLKKNLEFIEGVEAYLIGSSDLEIDIALAKLSDHKIMILDGSPWRLAVDIFKQEIIPPVDASKPVQNEEPEYVPGDKPIETRFAEEPVKQKAEPVEHTEVVLENLPEIAAASQADEPIINFADSLPLIPESTLPELAQTETESETETANEALLPETKESEDTALDQNRINSILLHYYLAIGDTTAASAFGDPYSFDLITEDGVSENSDKAGLSATLAALVYRMPWLILVATLLTGVIGGLFGYWMFSRSFSFKLPTGLPKRKQKAKTVAAEPIAEEIERDLDTLDHAVEREPEPVMVEEPVPEPVIAAEEGEAAEAQSDEEVKETAMERRVKRVLELSKGGHNVEAIAKQLEMSQDEVKLILDLN